LSLEALRVPPDEHRAARWQTSFDESYVPEEHTGVLLRTHLSYVVLKVVPEGQVGEDWHTP